MNRTPRIRYFSGQSFRITISVSCFFFLKTSVDPKIYKKKSKWKKKHVFLLISYVRICFLFKIIACWVFVAFLSIIILVLPCLTTHTEKIIFFFKNPAPQDWIQVSACELVVLAATQGETSVLSRKSADVFVSKKKRGEWKMPTHKKSSDGPLLSLGSWKKKIDTVDVSSLGVQLKSEKKNGKPDGFRETHKIFISETFCCGFFVVVSASKVFWESKCMTHQ